MYFTNYLKELVFPTSCGDAGETAGQQICPECLLALPLIPAPACRGLCLPHALPGTRLQRMPQAAAGPGRHRCPGLLS